MLPSHAMADPHAHIPVIVAATFIDRPIRNFRKFQILIKKSETNTNLQTQNDDLKTEALARFLYSSFEFISNFVFRICVTRLECLRLDVICP